MNDPPKHITDFLIEKVLVRAGKEIILLLLLHLRLPHTGPHMRVAGLRGGRYFTHFEVVRVMRLAACMMERAHTSTKNDFQG